MANDSGNGSYQKYDGASGTYQTIDSSIDNNNGSSRPVNKKFRYVLGLAAVAAVLLGIYYAKTTPNPQANIDKTIGQSGKVTVKANGKLKLFDSLSKYSSSSFSEVSFSWNAIARTSETHLTNHLLLLLHRPICLGRL